VISLIFDIVQSPLFSHTFPEVPARASRGTILRIIAFSRTPSVDAVKEFEIGYVYKSGAFPLQAFRLPMVKESRSYQPIPRRFGKGCKAGPFPASFIA
jgi:hypothetical protein